MFGFLLLLATSTALAASTEAQPTLTATVSKSEITVGERFTYTLVVEAPELFTIEDPAKTKHLGDFEVKGYESPPPTLSNGRTKKNIVYTLAIYEVGEVELPEFQLRAFDGQRNHILKAKPVPITVLATAAEGDLPEDIKPLVSVPGRFEWAKLLLLALPLVALLGVLGAVFIRGRRPKPLLPFEVAEEAMRNLMQARHYENERFKEFFYALSSLVKSYLQASFGVGFTGMTTTQIEAAFSAAATTIPDQKTYLQLFRYADRVKFSHYLPERSVAFGFVKKFESILAEHRRRHAIELKNAKKGFLSPRTQNGSRGLASPSP